MSRSVVSNLCKRELPPSSSSLSKLVFFNLEETEQYSSYDVLNIWMLLNMNRGSRVLYCLVLSCSKTGGVTITHKNNLDGNEK